MSTRDKGNDDPALELKFRPYGKNGNAKMIAVLAGNPVHTDEVNTASSRQRARFLDDLRRKVPDLTDASFDNLRGELERIAYDLQIKSAEKEGAPADGDDEGPSYEESDGRIVQHRRLPGGAVSTQPLCTFTARIDYETVRDDGAEQTRHYTISGRDDRLAALPQVEVPVSKYGSMEWVRQCWGTRAIVFAGAGTKDHLATAVELISRPVPRRQKYAHTGWRKLEDGRMVYLTAGAVIGEKPVADVAVELSGKPADFALPEPADDAETLCAAVAASLDILDVAPDVISVPMLSAAYRAPLGHAELALFVVGQTQIFKSQMCGLVQGHWGPRMDGDHLPGNWKSTGNALESLCFAVKDTACVLDDFKPVTPAEMSKLEEIADRVFRGNANNSGRLRANRDGTLRADRPSRCLPIASGEQLPETPSLRGRTIIVSVRRGDVKVDRLTEAQEAAAKGLHALAMSGYLRWLAPRFERLTAQIDERTAKARERIRRAGMLPRTPGQVAALYVGAHTFVQFARDVGAITAQAQRPLLARIWRGLRAVAERQADYQGTSDPVEHVLGLLASVLGRGQGHLMPVEPEEMARAQWGWSKRGSEWLGGGPRLGFVDRTHVYLDPSAFAEAQRLATAEGRPLTFTPDGVWRAMHERGMLAKVNPVRRTMTAAKQVGGDRMQALWLVRAKLPTAWNAEAEDPPDGLES